MGHGRFDPFICQKACQEEDLSRESRLKIPTITPKKYGNVRVNVPREYHNCHNGPNRIDMFTNAITENYIVRKTRSTYS